MSFKNELSYQEFAWLISEIRTKIEGTDNDSLAHKYLIFNFLRSRSHYMFPNLENINF